MNSIPVTFRPPFSVSTLTPPIGHYKQTGCRLQGAIPGNLTCPDFVLPEIAYQVFQELRWIIRAPDEVIMAAILAAMSTACQWWIRVKPPHMDAPHVTTLAIYTGADTGSGKSPVTGRLFAPMHLIRHARIAKRKQEKKERSDDRLLLRAKQRNLLGKVGKIYGRGMSADPDELAQAEQALRNLPDIDSPASKPINMVKADISPSRLLEELDGTRVSILLATPEGRNFFGKMTDEDMEMHNQVWDGATVPYERMHRTVIANEPLATYCAMTHPDALARFIKKKGDEARASGWFGRGLLSKAPSSRNPVPAILHPSLPKTDAFNARSTVLLEGCEQFTADSSFEPITLEFDEAATVTFMEMLRENDRRMASRDEWGLVQDFGRKHPSNVARIAAIFHYFSEQPGTLISRDTLMNAIRIADWYVEQAKQILVTEPMQYKLKRLVDFLHDKCFVNRKHANHADRGQEELIPTRWIMQFHNIEREELDPLLDMLAQDGVIEYHFSFLGKRCIWLNPMHFNTL
ncbi:DUF3987 domain-containing protein [Rhodanobacter sp. DHG33]|uniref:DUF3987 domain-containing protein n=1 Tax=Rhodanobacter sp. DHG33 TaxID=2775921 RepID=UPI00177B8B3A|nr:DUF3987 domain-containing protein [Rhodanobacter sp. DHG33]MBD8898575.1 DUF3987 domain-containing protein [Rhodanobacter sp. DHG33]